MATQRERLGTAPASPPLWRDPRVRAIVYQILTLVGVLGFAAYIIHNTMENLSRQGIASGFGFLSQPAGLAIPQTLIAYSEDPVTAPKVVMDFAKTNDKLVILGGAMGSTTLNADGVKSLATMPSLDELRAKLLGMIQTPATRIAGVVQAPAAQLARVFSAYAKKDEAA